MFPLDARRLNPNTMDEKWLSFLSDWPAVTPFARQEWSLQAFPQLSSVMRWMEELWQLDDKLANKQTNKETRQKREDKRALRFDGGGKCRARLGNGRMLQINQRFDNQTF